MLNRAFVTTSVELPGYRITRNLGVVRGIVVRSRTSAIREGSRLARLLPPSSGDFACRGKPNSASKKP